MSPSIFRTPSQKDPEKMKPRKDNFEKYPEKMLPQPVEG
jgi:hypothetical protein